MFVCNSVTRWRNTQFSGFFALFGGSRVEVGAGHLQTFLCERKITFFSPCVKYVFDFLRLPPPSFSGFFALFGGSRVEVGGGHLQTFSLREKIFVLTVRPPNPNCKALVAVNHMASADTHSD